MKKRLIVKYIIMYLPMVVGIILFSFGSINLVSSLLLFLGGYNAIKNTFDYRKVRKNIKKVEIVDNKGLERMEKRKENNVSQVYVKPKIAENIVGFKRTRRYTRVRKIR